MKPFVAVIGSRNSGKSTIIRSLTGAKSGQFRGVITDNSTGRTIEVIGSSPQEQALTLVQLRAILRRAANAAVCNGVVCALQPTLPSKRLSMEQVFHEAASFGFLIHAYVLDPGYAGSSGSSSQVVRRVKAAGYSARTLNGQRFAQVNAATINRATKVAA